MSRGANKITRDLGKSDPAISWGFWRVPGLGILDPAVSHAYDRRSNKCQKDQEEAERHTHIYLGRGTHTHTNDAQEPNQKAHDESS